MDNIVQFRLDLCNLFNNADLPFSAKYFVLKDVMNEVEQTYQQYVVNLQKQASVPDETDSREETLSVEIPKEVLDKVKE